MHGTWVMFLQALQIILTHHIVRTDITKLHAEEVSHEEASRRQGIIEVKTEKAVEALGRPIIKLRDGINWCIQQGKLYPRPAMSCLHRQPRHM